MKRYKFLDDRMMLGVSENAAHEDVCLVQDMLRRFGYLRVPFKRGSYGDETARAVRRYQRFHHLTVDGKVGPETKQSLSSPRCSMEDETGFSSSFVARGCKYDDPILTYAFTGGTPDLPLNQERDVVQRAFDAWAQVSPLRFVEVLPEQGPHLRISWETGDHGDGSQNAFDGPGFTLAHAYYPPPCGGPFAGSLHFDEGENWTLDTAGIHLEAVAIHEIGHLLGLGHSDDRDAIMFPNYRANVLTLGQDDIEGIRAIYGARQAREIVLQGAVGGHLSGSEQEARFQVELPGTAEISLGGPPDADFDLYIKRGAQPTPNDFDLRAWTSSADETLLVTPPSPGTYHILVYSYRGEGNYELRVKLV